MNSNAKLLITGASGFTGMHACEYFSNQSYDVIAISRKQMNVAKEIQVEYGDLIQRSHVKSLVKQIKPDYVVHLAGQNHVGKSWVDPISSLETNVMGTVNLLDTVRQVNPACKIVIIGSALQFDPGDLSTLQHPYSLSKTLQVLVSKAWGALYNMNIVIAKPSNLIGPGNSNGVVSIFAEKIVNMELYNADKTLTVNNLYAQRDFIDVRDAVCAYDRLLQKGEPGEIYAVSSGKSRPLIDIVKGLKELTTIDFEIQTETDQKEKPVEANPSKLMKLGWKPMIPFETSLEDILRFYRQTAKQDKN